MEDVAEIVRSMPDKPIFIAHSMSGRVSMSLLSKQDVARKFVLVDIAPEIPELTAAPPELRTPPRPRSTSPGRATSIRSPTSRCPSRPRTRSMATTRVPKIAA